MPITVTRRGDGVHVTEQFEVRAGYSDLTTTGSSPNIVPTGFSDPPEQVDYVSWTRSIHDSRNGMLTHVDRYHKIPDSTTGQDLGTLSTNFHRTSYRYDDLGRMEYEIEVVSGTASSSAVEQVTKTVHDLLGRPTSVQKAISGAGEDVETTLPSSMTTVREMIYDGGVQGGDSHVTTSKEYFGTGSTDYTGTQYQRDFRGRLRGIASSEGVTKYSPYTVQDLDWAGNVTATAVYDAEPSWTGTGGVIGTDVYAGATTSSDRRRLTKTHFDRLGRAFRSERYIVNASDGSLGDRFVTERYYDRNNRVVGTAEVNGSATEIAYDGAGRQYQSRTVLALSSTPYTSGAYNYVAPVPKPALGDMSGGNAGVISMSHTVFDSSGNATQQHMFEANQGDNNGLAMSANEYVRRSLYSWYDDAERLTTSADYGSGDGTAGQTDWRYASAPSPSSAPTASTPEVLVSKYAYNAETGRQELMTDDAGTKTKYHRSLRIDPLAIVEI